jgi:uncharacterized protein (TIGR03084 family)
MHPKSSTENAVALDLRDEYRALGALCATLAPEAWNRRSAFHGWTPWDEIAHLCYFDETALQSVRDPARFAIDATRLGDRVARGEQISAIARDAYGHLDGAALLTHWRATHERLVGALAPLDPKARLAWYGPPMSARSFATARLMETWAHGQDVWDVLRRRRPATPRLRHIAHLGVTTMGWAFANRGLAVPAVAPRVQLDAPDGTVWAWGDEASGHRVSGSAEDFCLLVTQRRHVDDTALRYTDGPAAEWLHIAQCFAGPPADGPQPGERLVGA